MIYIVCYLLIGLLLVIIKSPVREVIDKDIRMMNIQSMAREEEVPTIKFILFRIIISALLILLYPFILYGHFKDRLKKRKNIKSTPAIKSRAHISWLKEQVTVQEAESRHMVELGGHSIPFGYCHNQWRALLSSMKEGDILHEFRSSDESWKYLAGREGIALVRDGQIVADIITRMN